MLTPTQGGPIERALARALAARQSADARQSDHTSNYAAREHISGSQHAVETTAAKKSQFHAVSTTEHRRKIVKWMVETSNTDRDKQIVAKALRQFPEHFTGTYKSNHAKAKSWWLKRDALLGLRISKGCSAKCNISFVADHGKRRASIKAMPGRGRRRQPWVADLYVVLPQEFETLAGGNVKLSPAVLRCVAIKIMKDVDSMSTYHHAVIQEGKPLVSKITERWVQRFMINHSLVVRRQAGKLALSLEKGIFIENTISYHLGQIKRGFEFNELEKNCVENADETHFLINMDNRLKIDHRGDQEIQYADVVSGDEGITMMVRITGGAEARIETPMLIFQSKSCSYRIRGVEYNIPGVSYRNELIYLDQFNISVDTAWWSLHPSQTPCISDVPSACTPRVRTKSTTLVPLCAAKVGSEGACISQCLALNHSISHLPWEFDF